MGDAKDYQRDFERLIAPAEERADRIADQKAKEFQDELLRRCKAVGIPVREIARQLESEGGLKRILTELKRREAGRTSRKTKSPN